MNAIIITAIICVTLVAIEVFGGSWKDKMLKEQSALLCKYKAMVDALLVEVERNVGALEATDIPLPAAAFEWVRTPKGDLAIHGPLEDKEIDGGE